jgi:hypothetical protein
MCWDADLPRALVERIWNQPQALLAAGLALQDKPRCTVVRIEDPSGTYVWKHHNWGTLRRTIERSLSRSTARKTWTDGRFLSDAGVPTPQPRAFIERRIGPFQRFSYVLSDYVPGTSLYRLMRFERPSQELVHDLARQVAAIWQRLDELRVWHNDFKTENLLVDPQGKVWLIDLERTRRYRDVQRMRRRQARDAADLLHPRNWRADPRAAEIFRQEIMKTPAAFATLAAPDGAEHPLRRPAPSVNRAAQLVTVFIPTLNSADTILPCLDSVRDMADEILVADTGSTDDTLLLVRNSGGCRIIQGAGSDPAALEARAAAQARYRWVLRILPEEQLNPDLARQVQDTLATEPAEDGYMISRSVHFRGRRLKHGGFQHDASVRLYRKDVARYELREGRVEVALASHRIGSLRSRLVYESCTSIEHFLTESVRRANEAAAEAHRRGERPKRRSVLLRAPWQFVKTYFVRAAWLDGWAGLHASYLSALAIYLREMLLWGMDRPPLVQRSALREEWRALRVFDPGGTAELADSLDESTDAQREALRQVRTAA